LDSKLKEGVGGCMYISGVPGTGKTATVHEVVKTLQDEDNSKPKKKGKKSTPVRNDFTFIEINGLRLTDPYQAYSQIYHEITGEKMSAKAATNYLNDYFLGESEEFVVLLVDELDVLCTKKQTILYHLFDWPNRPNSNLVVIAIANAMDLPERVMMSRIASRLGLTRLTFQPYTHQELQEIVKSRLKGIAAFDSDAVQLVARKVAAVSGDARRALDICRRATLIAEQNNTSAKSKDCLITMKDVNTALQEMFFSTKIVAIREGSEQEQNFLKAVVQEFRSSGLEEAVFTNVYEHHIAICKFDGIYCPSTDELFAVAENLYDLRLILLDTNASYLNKKIRLNISTDDVDFALKPLN
jgi:origin recognition complex subunit 1